MKFNTKACLLLLCVFLFIGSTNRSTASQITNPSARTDYKEFEIVKNTFNILLNSYAHPVNANDLFLEAARGIIGLQGMNEIFKKRGINIQVLSSGPIKTFSSNTTITQVQNELERMYDLCIRKNPHLEPIHIALDASMRGHRVSTNLSTTLEEKGFYVLAASRENEAAIEKDDLFHGVFTYSILDGLKGKADFNKDSIIDVIELFNFVELNVSELTNGYQHPHFIKGGKGLQVFALE